MWLWFNKVNNTEKKTIYEHVNLPDIRVYNSTDFRSWISNENIPRRNRKQIRMRTKFVDKIQ